MRTSLLLALGALLVSGCSVRNPPPPHAGGGKSSVPAVPTAPSAPADSSGSVHLRFPPVRYSDFATAQTPASFAPQHPAYRSFQGRQGGLVPPLRTVGIGHGLLYFSSLQSVIPVPYGWYAYETPEEGQLWRADQQVRVRLSWKSLQPFEGDFGRFQAESLRSLTLPRAPGEGVAHSFLIPGGGFGFRVDSITEPHLPSRALLAFYSPAPSGSGRTFEMLLSAPQSEIDLYVGLLGLLLRDRILEAGEKSTREPERLPDVSVTGRVTPDGRCEAEVDGVRYGPKSRSMDYDFDSYTTLSSPTAQTLAFGCVVEAADGRLARFQFFVFETLKGAVRTGTYLHTLEEKWQDRPLEGLFAHLSVSFKEGDVVRSFVARSGGVLHITEATESALGGEFHFTAQHRP